MTSTGVFDEAKYRFGGNADSRQLDWRLGTSQVFKAVLVDLDDFGVAISGASQANPCVITTSTNHGLSTGERVVIYGVAGMTTINDAFEVEVTDSTHFRLKNYMDGTNVDSSSFTAYSSGGRVYPMTSGLRNLSDIASGARIATATLANPSNSNGVLSCDNFTFTGVPDNSDVSEAIIIYREVSGNEAQSTLISMHAAGTGLPADPDGGNINVSVPARGLVRL